jgi:hypothetical protein
VRKHAVKSRVNCWTLSISKLGEAKSYRFGNLERKMNDYNVIRVQQAQKKKKPSRTKPLIWKIFKGAVSIFSFIYKIWKFLEGDFDE